MSSFAISDNRCETSSTSNPPSNPPAPAVSTIQQPSPHSSSSSSQSQIKKTPMDRATLEREANQRKEKFLMFTRVLMKYLEKKDPIMHDRAKDVIKECADGNKKKERGYECLTLAMRRRLRATVGDVYWKKAEDYLNHFIKQKMLQHKKQQEKIKDEDNWVVVKETYPSGISGTESISKTEREILGNRDGYADRDAAIEVAMDGTNYDDDEEISISVVRLSEMKRKEAADKRESDNARKAAKAAANDYWIVVKDTYPSGTGRRHLGGRPPSSDGDVIVPIERKLYGKRKDKDASIEVAKWLLNNLTCFQNWGPKFYGDRPPPYATVDGENRDKYLYVNGEEVVISVVRFSEMKRQEQSSGCQRKKQKTKIEDQYQRLKAKIAADQAQQQHQHTGGPSPHPSSSTSNQSSSKTSQPTSRWDPLTRAARERYAIPADLSKKKRSITSTEATNLKKHPNKKLKTQNNEDDNWVVVKDTYPSGYGCHLGQPRMSDAAFISHTEREIVGNKKGYTDKDAAITAAKCERDHSEWFEDWGSAFYGDRPPPYESAKARNFDNDEEITISVVRISEMKRREVDDKKIREKARKAAVSKAAKATARLKAAIQKKGDVHYSWPNRPEIDIPAEVELMITERGTFHRIDSRLVNKGNEFDYSATASPAIPVTELSAILAGVESLMVRPERPKERFKHAPQGEHFQAGLLQVLTASTSLREFHWHFAKVSPELLQRIDQCTNLKSTLETLSLPLARSLYPDAVRELKCFHALRKLVLNSSFDMDEGTGHPKFYRSYGDDDIYGKAVDEPMPYTEELLDATSSENMPHLKIVDLDGILDFDKFQYCLDDHVEWKLKERGVKLKLGKKKHW